MSKELQRIKEMYEYFIKKVSGNENEELRYAENKDFETIEKYLKVLEILKTKECNIHALLLHLKRFDSPSGYNALVGDKYKLTEQEYDLLKEVLL